METRIQLKHPEGKKAVTMDKTKYEPLKKAILAYLKKHKEATHTELFDGIEADLKKNKVKFEGNVQWHMEWVKLDLEANKKIKRVGKTPVKLALK